MKPDTDEATKAVLDHVDVMVDYWLGEPGRSNVPVRERVADAIRNGVDPAKLPGLDATVERVLPVIRESLEGLAFSLLVMLDGGSVGVPLGWLQPVGEDGELGENIAGSLHESWSARRRS